MGGATIVGERAGVNQTYEFSPLVNRLPIAPERMSAEHVPGS